MQTPANDAPQVTLLIVEDEILPAMALRDELEDAGYRVMDLTGRWQEALAAVKDCKPDLALVNIKLHGRNDGIGLAKDLKAQGIPVLFISGQESRARTARTVAIGSLPKPYSVADMVVAVNFLLAHLKGDDSLPRPPALEVFDGTPDDVPNAA
jgi:two-component system, response regulator PdtaR